MDRRRDAIKNVNPERNHLELDVTLPSPEFDDFKIAFIRANGNLVVVGLNSKMERPADQEKNRSCLVAFNRWTLQLVDAISINQDGHLHEALLSSDNNSIVMMNVDIDQPQWKMWIRISLFWKISTGRVNFSRKSGIYDCAGSRNGRRDDFPQYNLRYRPVFASDTLVIERMRPVWYVSSVEESNTCWRPEQRMASMEINYHDCCESDDRPVGRHLLPSKYTFTCYADGDYVPSNSELFFGVLIIPSNKTYAANRNGCCIEIRSKIDSSLLFTMSITGWESPSSNYSGSDLFLYGRTDGEIRDESDVLVLMVDEAKKNLFVLYLQKVVQIFSFVLDEVLDKYNGNSSRDFHFTQCHDIVIKGNNLVAPIRRFESLYFVIWKWPIDFFDSCRKRWKENTISITRSSRVIAGSRNQMFHHVDEYGLHRYEISSKMSDSAHNSFKIMTDALC